MFKKLYFTVFFSILVSPAFSHGDGDFRVEVLSDAPEVREAGKIKLVFQLRDIEEKKLLADKDLNIVHEKLIHMFIFDSALKAFHHVHPEYLNSEWVVEAEVTVTGEYWIWAQGQLKSDGEDFASPLKLSVVNGIPANPLPPQLGDVRTGSDGESVATLSNSKFRAGKMAMPTLKLSRSDGHETKISPFLGAPVHVMGTPSDGDALIHIHPMELGEPHSYMLHLTFPAKGEYRLWVQYIDNEVLRTIPLSVIVG